MQGEVRRSQTNIHHRWEIFFPKSTPLHAYPPKTCRVILTPAFYTHAGHPVIHFEVAAPATIANEDEIMKVKPNQGCAVHIFFLCKHMYIT